VLAEPLAQCGAIPGLDAEHGGDRTHREPQLGVGEALNVLEGTDLVAACAAEYPHWFLEASKLSFADRNR